MSNEEAKHKPVRHMFAVNKKINIDNGIIRPPDKSAFLKINFIFSQPKHVVGTQKNRLEPPPPIFKYPMKMKTIWSRRDQIISFSWYF